MEDIEVRRVLFEAERACRGEPSGLMRVGDIDAPRKHVMRAITALWPYLDGPVRDPALARGLATLKRDLGTVVGDVANHVFTLPMHEVLDLRSKLLALAEHARGTAENG